MLEEKDCEINNLNKKVIELQNDKSKFENQKLKDFVSCLELEVRQSQERIQMLRQTEDKIARENHRYTSELIQERIGSVQILQIELSSKENELILMNKKIKNLNYTVLLYKDQVEKFNKKK